MTRIFKAIQYGYGIALLLTMGLACSKGGDPAPPPPPPSSCAGKNITVTATGTDADPCTANGTITATGSGSTGLTYQITGTGFQTSGNFNSLPAGSYTVTVKDGEGCTATANVTINTKAITNGPLWSAVRNLVSTRCAIPGCHSGPAPQAGLDFTQDCTVIREKNDIKTHAVDIGDMPFGGPQLSATDKKKITDWIDAGGRLTD
jgi:hypothetical protein